VPDENGKTLAGLFAETKEELKAFATTRIDMLKAEMRDKVSAWKVAVPLIAVALVLAVTGWLVLTACLITAIAVAFYGSPWAYTFSTLIVGVAYVLCGVIAGTFALRGLKEYGVAPKRTMRVLKEDRAWLATEARSQI
jgi:hypothetical protein